MMRHQIPEGAKNGVLATGGLIGAFGASSCCILPLVLALAGVGGAWIGALAILAPYQSVFLGIGALSVGSGFWRIHGRKQPVCDGRQCGTAASRRWTEAGLWFAAAVLLIAAATDWWAPLLT